MAVSTQVVRFTKETTGVTNVTQDVSLNFTPKAILVFSTCQTGNDAVEAHYQLSQGFSDGTNSACVCITSDDGDPSADTQHVYSNDSVYVRMSETSNATVLERATCAFITNGVRLTWAVASTTATYITIWAIGGTDITNAKVNTVAINRVGAGTQNYTGLGFTPAGSQNSALFTLMANKTAASNTSETGATSSLGCAVSTAKRWTEANAMEDTRDPTDTWRVHSSGTCINCLNATDGTLQSSADFSAWITDGFTLNWTTNPGTTVLFSYLVIEGGTWDVGTLTAPLEATNDVDTAVSVSSRTLRGLMMATDWNNVSDSIIVNSYLNIGVTDGTTQSTLWNLDADNAPTVISNRFTSGVSILTFYSNTDVELIDAVFDSFGTNSFRLDWLVKTAVAHLIPWVVVADAAAAAVAVEEFPAKSFGIIGLTNTTGNQTIFG